MTNLSTTGANQALNALDASGSPTNLLAFTSLHSASPSTTGANENAATGGYARQSTTWNAASSGAKTNSTALTFSTAGTVAVTDTGGFSAVTAGTFGIGEHLGSSVTAASITVASGAISLSAS
jgi:hypothetical protein